ncbi:hypothetical protein [Glycomyces algeriensis]|uniref:Secreted protein n=1 Tax=Glycomyces algeriensis TaxID=256037 RepID=A0A9W6GD37_9ACTN|nr:hypothetical protein [Glycomyces algeriensis]MDA1367817.1 hypothetical protein [Glycomyces algeriensis]MDR7351963.1 hypothetical protein [Glycomyces algeriensis]GLI44696.1 hypothetical protein GALLR39Z86_45460 [Glycomyces algeriensis]
MTSLNRRQFNRSLLALPAAALVGTGLGSLAAGTASAAPADWNTQFLAGTLGSNIMRQTRYGGGSWNARWNEIAPDPVHKALYSISAAGISSALHIVACIGEEGPKHAVRNTADGSSTPFSPIPSQSGPTGIVLVAAASVGTQLHVFASIRDSGDLYHTVRNGDGTWWASWKRLRSFANGIEHIATAKVGTTIDTAVVSNGEILHAIRSSGGTWTGWGNIEGAAGEIGDVNEVTLAGIGSSLHVVAMTTRYGLHHAIRRADATWQRFQEPAVLEGRIPFSASAANAGGELQLGILELSDGKQVASHTIRRADGTWQPVRFISTAGLTDTDDDLANLVLAVTPR